MSDFNVPSELSSSEQTIKKSRFIGMVAPVEDHEQALAFITDTRSQYGDAGHVCWAYIIGDPANSSKTAFSDDGEPSGTAGRPILNVLQQNLLGNVVAVVIRYFGGIKLGAGGLTRAYSSTIAAAVQTLSTTEYVKRTQLLIELPYALEDFVRRNLAQHGASIQQRRDAQSLEFIALIDHLTENALKRVLSDGSNGRIRCSQLDEK